MSTRVIAFYCLCWSIWKVQATIYNENITDFSKCNTHISRSEGKYGQFYEINKDERPENDLLLFDFHFGVLAKSDAHILLAESDVLLKTDRVYEIVIGAGSNTFSDLRSLQKSASKVTARIKGLLSGIEIRSFWIHVWIDGLVEVGKETEELAFLAWKDPQPIDLKFFSFSTWPGVEAKWFFDCERKIAKGSKLIQTNKERLKYDLLQNYNIFTIPILNESDIMDVELSLIPQSISLDVGASKLSIKGSGHMKWRDRKLKWNAEDYGDIKMVKLPSYQLWTPDLRLHDQQVNLEEAILYQNGSVFCNIHLDLTYWCNIKDLGAWPADVHNCSLSFRFMRDGGNIRLEYVSKREDFFRSSSASEWSVMDLDIRHEQVGDESIDYATDEPTKLTFFFTLQRTSNIYKLIFFTPFLVISIFSLCTFWTSPLGYLKITLCCAQLIMETIILICISIIVPGHSSTVPVLVTLYSDSLISTIVLVIISIIVINLSRNKYKKNSMPDIVSYVLSSNILQGVLLLPRTKNENIYGKLSENSIRKKDDPEESQWILLGNIIDRISFIAYSIFFIFIISRTY